MTWQTTEGRYLAPRYAAPPGGLAAWSQPDAASPVAAYIPARVEMNLLERYGDWAHIECNNGWRAWVDARALVPAPASSVGARQASNHRPRSAWNPAITTIGRYTVTLVDLVPAVVIVLGAALPWLRGGIGASTGFEVPVTFLVDTTPSATPIKVGVVLAVVALVALAAPARMVRFGAYAVALAVLAVYVIQLQRLLHQAQAGIGLGSALGAGVYVGIVGALLGLARTLVPGHS